MKKRLAEFAGGTYSQYGEDGITEEIFRAIGARSKVCVEIGAWDGLHLSNTAHFWTKGWKAVLIEGDPKKFAALLRNSSGHDCTCVQAMVTPQGPSSIDALLEKEGVTPEFDLLCIDIDGDDYHLLESMRAQRPRVIICEYNPTIPAHMDVVADPGNYFGCSVAALVRIGSEKGYSLAALTDTNVFLVRNDDFPRLAAYETSLEAIRIDKHLAHLVTSYAGDYLVAGSPPFGVHFPYRGGVKGPVRRVRFKPEFLRLGRPIRRAWRRLFS